MMTDTNGQAVQVLGYTPFGVTKIDDKPQGEVFNAKYKFTGQESDAESHLYYYGARYYHAGFGKFYSVDPALFDPGYMQSVLENPQALNSYSYVVNNPVNCFIGTPIIVSL